jgi:hypothetical protein
MQAYYLRKCERELSDEQAERYLLSFSDVYLAIARIRMELNKKNLDSLT